MRPVTSELLFRLGRIPDALTSFVMDGLDDEIEDAEAETIRIARENPIEWLDYIDAVVATAFVMPRIVDNPSADDEISIDDVEKGDKEYVAGLVFMPASQLARFLEGQSESRMDVVDDEQKHRTSSKQVASD